MSLRKLDERKIWTGKEVSSHSNLLICPAALVTEVYCQNAILGFLGAKGIQSTVSHSDGKSLFSPCRIAQAMTSSAMWNRSRKNRHVLLLTSGRKLSVFYH